MSIIHDALKKVQQSMQQKNSSSNPENPPEEIVEVLPSSSSNTDKKEQNKDLFKTVFITMIALLVIGFSGKLILSQIQSKYPHFLSGMNLNFSFKPFQKQAKPKPLAQIIIPKTPVRTTSQSQTASNAPQQSTASGQAIPPTILNVQGIMANSNHNVALINNGVYEEGSVINGQKIVKINLDAIVVEHDGQQQIIPIKR